MQRKQRESFTDEVTGLLNNRGLSQYIQDKIDSKAKFFIINIELREFSLFHGNYGHEIADRMLMHIGSQIRGEIGKSGNIARINSAEFVVVANSPDFSREKLTEYIVNWNNKKITVMSGKDQIECY